MPVPDVQKIGKYEILAELGQGGFGRVYRAFDPTVGRPVAIKILTTEGNRDLLTRFRNEATAAGNLRHRNIVTVYDYGEYNGRPYLVMELLEGEDLTQVIGNRTPLSLLQKMNIMDQVAAGLDCAHQNGVLHRDVKPANIRILPDGTVKIMDFGIARVSSDRNATRLTQQGDLIGTILYMSPEQFGGSEADALCDIFAYGLIYFELLTGTHPFRSSDPRTVMFKITMADPEPLRSLDPTCPEGLERILNRALQKDRELRYQSLRDLQLDTEPLIFELRQARARELVAEAVERCGSDESRKVLLLINEALNLDPSNREAREFRETVQRQVQREALQPRIEALVQAGTEQLMQRAFPQAIQSIEAAQKLDPADERIRGLLENAQAQLTRAKEAAKTASLALAHASRDEWLAAAEHFAGAAQLDPEHPEIHRVRREIGKQVHRALARVDQRIADQLLDDALRELRDLAVLQPDSPEIQNRFVAARALQEARGRIQAATESALRNIEEGDYEAALKMIDTQLAATPGDQRLAELRGRAQAAKEAREREELVGHVVAEVLSDREARRLEQALEHAQGGLDLYPHEPRLQELKTQLVAELEVERLAESVRNELETAYHLIDLGRAAEAVEALERAVELYPENEELHTLLAQARRKQSVKSLLEECDRNIAANQLDRALELIRGALKADPAETSLTERHDQLIVRKVMEVGTELLAKAQPARAVELLESAVSRHPQSELKDLLQRARAELLSLRRREAVAAALAEADRNRTQQESTRAIQGLETALVAWPEDVALTAALQEAREAQRVWERQKSIERVTQETRGLAENRRLAEALRTVEKGLAKFPDEPALLQLRRELRDELAEQQRAEALRRAHEEGGELLRQGRAEEAIRILATALENYPSDASLKALLAEAHAAHEAQRRQEAVTKAAADVRQLAARDDFAAAKAKLESALTSFPGEEALLKAGRDAEELAALAESRRRIQAVLKLATQQAAQNHPGDALSTLQKGLQDYPGEPELLALEKRLQAQRERDRRLAAAEQAAKDARELLEQGKPGRAVEVLEHACGECPESAPLTQMLAQARDAMEVRRKRDAVQKIAGDVQKSVERKDFSGAIGILAKGLKAWPDEPLLADLLKRTKNQQTVREVALQITRLVRDGRPQEAQKHLQAGLGTHGPDPALTELEQQVRTQLASQKPDGKTTRFSSGSYILAGAAVALAIAAGVAIPRMYRDAGSVPLALDSNVSGASVSIAGQTCIMPACDLHLSPGSYQLVATKDGYSRIERAISVRANAQGMQVPLDFSALPQVIQVNTNFESGQVLLDGAPAGALRDGQINLDRIAPGNHTIRVTGGEADFEAQWRAEAGAPPQLTQPVVAKNVKAMLLANAGKKGTMTCNCDMGSARVDGALVGGTAAAGSSLSLDNLQEGARRIAVSDRSMVVDVRPNPTLNIFLSLDRNAGTLIVQTGQDQATVFLNDRPYRRLTERGLVRIPLDVGEYSVRVEKNGFRPVPATKVAVSKGEEKQLALTLTPLPAILEISGALPDALVRLDGKPLGETSANGGLRAEVAAGDHELEFVKQDYTPVRIGARFTAGEVTRPRREQVVMARVIQAPQAPDPRQLEAQDWEKVRNSNQPDDLDEFIRKHPGGSYIEGARTRASQLRQQAQLNAARQAEQADWDSVDKSRKAALQEFMSRHANGARQQEARALIAELEKREAEKKAAEALVAAARIPAEQPKAVDSNDRESDATRRNLADQQGIAQTLSQYETAYNAKNLGSLQRIWRGMPKPVADALGAQFRYARELAFQLRPSAAPVVNGDSATVICTRRLDLTTSDRQRVNSGNERVQVTLDRVGPGWVIRAVTTLQ